MRVSTTRSGAAMRVMPRDRQRRPEGRALIDLRPGERPSERRPLVADGHIPVMVEEVVHFLQPQPGGIYIDGTVGGGGHAEALIKAAGGTCQLIGIDRDASAIARSAENLRHLGASVRLVCGGYEEMEHFVEPGSVDGILLDLGMSSMQVDDPERGFSFHRSGPLDMRMNPSDDVTAAQIVNGYSTHELTQILRMYGEERFAHRIATAIVDARRAGPIRTTDQLATIVASAYPAAARRQTHPARRTFQALRIEVNRELERLRIALEAAHRVLKVDGRIAVISYHSLEDRLVKSIIKAHSVKDVPLPGLEADASEATMQPVGRGSLLVSDVEAHNNPRARSARMRVAERIK